MKITTKMAVGVGAALVLIIILVLVANDEDGDEIVEEEEEEVSDEIDEDLVEQQAEVDAQLTIPPPPEPPATCATHTCPDGYEKDLDEVVGDTDETCCRKPLCDADTIQCPGSKIVNQNSRGLDPSECCELPFCTDKAGGVCNSPSLKLKSSEQRGASDAECCDTLPSCSSHVCGSGYTRANDASSRYGNTDGECCVLKTCAENKWGIANGRKCTSKGMKWIDENADEVGNSEDACCIEATCFENGFNDDKCGNPRKGGAFGNTPLMPTADDEAVFGQTHEQCCAPSKCDEEPIVSCPSGKTYKTPVPYATSVEDCCEDLKCGEWFANAANTCPSNKKRKGDNDIGFNESQCCSVKTCSDVESDGTCGEGKSVTSTAPLPSEYEAASYETHCCTDIKCNSPQSTFKTEAGCNEVIPESLDENVRDLTVATYALFKPINPLPDENAAQDKCCEAKLCSELTNIDCNKIGMKKDLEKNGRKWNHGDSPNSGGKECCIEKTCEDLKGEGGMSCPAGQQEKDDLETLMMTNLTGGETSSQKLTKFQNTCCRGQKCSDITPDCSSISINGTTNVMVVDDTKGNSTISGTNHKACCKFKTCSQLGWDDAKCKDKNYTRAAYRGGLKNGSAQGRPPTTEDNATTRSSSEGWGYQNLGDKLCCEHKPKTSSGGNYARQCVSKEYHNNTYKRKSPGVITARFMGTKLNTHALTVSNAEACKVKCDQNNSCDNFTMNRNGTCELWRGGSSASEHAHDLHGGVPLRGIIGIELGGGTSAAAGHTRATHYVSKNTFQGWGAGGHSTGTRAIGSSPWYSGKPGQNQIVVGQGMKITDTIDSGRNITTNQDAGACSPHSGYTNRPTCEDTTWKGRREVLLAGVDEEFCPYDFFQGYDHSSSVHIQPGSDAPARPATIATNSLGNPSASQHCHEMARGSYGNRSASKTVQNAVNSCYSDPNCTHIFVNTGGNNPWTPNNTGTHLHNRRIDHTSSRIGISADRGLMNSKHHRWTRRMCYGHHISTDSHVTNASANTHPGAQLIKTRFKNTREGNKKYTGRAPDKPTFSGAFPVESKILISGDTAV